MPGDFFCWARIFALSALLSEFPGVGMSAEMKFSVESASGGVQLVFSVDKKAISGAHSEAYLVVEGMPEGPKHVPFAVSKKGTLIAAWPVPAGFRIADQGEEGVVECLFKFDEVAGGKHRNPFSEQRVSLIQTSPNPQQQSPPPPAPGGEPPVKEPEPDPATPFRMFAFSLSGVCLLLFVSILYLYFNLRIQGRLLREMRRLFDTVQPELDVSKSLKLQIMALQESQKQLAARILAMQVRQPVETGGGKEDAEPVSMLKKQKEQPGAEAAVPSDPPFQANVQTVVDEELKDIVNRWWMSDSSLDRTKLESIREKQLPESKYFEPKNLSAIEIDTSHYVFEPASDWSGWLFAPDGDTSGIYYAIPTHAGYFRSSLEQKLLKRLYDGAPVGSGSFAKIEQTCRLKKETQGFRCLRKGRYQLAS